MKQHFLKTETGQLWRFIKQMCTLNTVNMDFYFFCLRNHLVQE